MSSAPSAVEIARDARWLAQALDPQAGILRLVAMNSESYRAASFLDDRMLQSPIEARIVDWPTIEAALTGNSRTDARWIFHIGHVGSTLVSRLIGEIDGVLAIREPRLLRDLAMTGQANRTRYIPAIPRLMSRTFTLAEIACVKATSFVSEIASALLPPGERSLFMYASPINYISTTLAGQSSLNDLRSLERSRSERLAARNIHLPLPKNEAERAAAAWATEITSLEVAADNMPPGQILWVDFDAMLLDMNEALAKTVLFFGFDASSDQIAAIAGGPLMQRYSKALEYEYSPHLRADLIRDSSRRNALDIRGAIAMLEKAAEKSPILASALRRSQPET